MKNPKKKIVYLFLLIIIIFSGIFFLITNTGGTNGEELRLHCGAGLKPPVSDIIENFERETEIKVSTNYGASNLLLGQLKVQEDGDLFLPGDDFYIEEAQKEGLIDYVEQIVYFVPVIMVQKGNPKNIETLTDLLKPDIKLALADRRAAAVGRITHEIFKKNNFWENIELFTDVDTLIQAYKKIIQQILENGQDRPKVEIIFKEMEGDVVLAIHHKNSTYRKSLSDTLERIGETQFGLINNLINGVCDFFIDADFGQNQYAKVNLWNGDERKASYFETFEGVRYILIFRK